MVDGSTRLVPMETSKPQLEAAMEGLRKDRFQTEWWHQPPHGAAFSLFSVGGKLIGAKSRVDRFWVLISYWLHRLGLLVQEIICTIGPKSWDPEAADKLDFVHGFEGKQSIFP